MEIQIIIALILNFIISIIGTLAYSVRLVGVRTKKVLVSFALFNILTLGSRLANSFQTPLLTKYVEGSTNASEILNIFYIILLVSGIATVVGAVLIPTFQKVFQKGVMSFSEDRSFIKLVLHSCTREGILYIKQCANIPSKDTITKLEYKMIPKKIVVYNTVAVALLVVGSMAPIYAGALLPELRATCLTLSVIINGVATILMSIFIDPHLSIMTDDVIQGKCSENNFRVCVISMVASKSVGTFLAIPLLIPCSYIITFVAKII